MLEFRVAFGSYPRTWVEFMHGLAHLGRSNVAAKLRLADASALPHRKADDQRQWFTDHRFLAGV